jgi:large subunit ribosomal protein L25
MKTIEINASLRKDIGKKSSAALRRQGIVPCVMYGGKEVIHFEAHENEFRHLIYTPNIYLVNLKIDGKPYQAILKEGQYHPVTDRIQHLDFVQVFEDQPSVVSLPITVTGSSEGLKAGGRLRQRMRYLKVKGLLKYLPETLEIDITAVNIGDVIKVNQLKYENLELLDTPQAMIVGVSTSRVVKVEEPGTEAAAAATAAETPAKAPSKAPAEG